MGIKERKEREKNLRKKDITKAAEKFFIYKGFDNTTMDEIAKACELAKGTLYLYFNSKEDILRSVINKNLTILYELIIKYQGDTKDPIERLNLIGKAHLEFYKKNPDHFRLLNERHIPGRSQNQLLASSKEGEQNILDERIKSIWKIIIEIIQSGKDMGIFRESTDPLEIAVSLRAVSMALLRMNDFKNNMLNNSDYEFQKNPIAGFDFINAITVNSKRIIFSILKNPPADYNMIKL